MCGRHAPIRVLVHLHLGKAEHLVDIVDAVRVARQRKVDERDKEGGDVLDGEVRACLDELDDLVPKDLKQLDILRDAAILLHFRLLLLLLR